MRYTIISEEKKIFLELPPTERSPYPGSEPPYETWYYGRFPITFVDRFYDGDYQLVTANLAVLNEINTALANVRKGQQRQIEQYEEGKAFFDIDLKIEFNYLVFIILIIFPDVSGMSLLVLSYQNLA